ncbi:branched-chain amino acid ABC transporter permease [Pseudomonadota bacterium]|jgi:branched-chain amino acid transport system permease protein|nr:branched-chain amino acid ABC transporter permease [Pseudomonadota bacterium]|tara:strand:- start:312 stop:1289 length:978 start_codon:yes stop_codon:yes gene_type:complete
MIKERFFNKWVFLLLLSIPAIGIIFNEPYYITLATKVIILGIAGVGLNLALGYGGLISFGHAAFFGIGGYVAAIMSYHALNEELLFEIPLAISGSSEMLIIWPLAIVISAFFSLLIGLLSLRTSGVYFIMITLAFAQMLYYFSISWPSYGGEDGLSMHMRNTLPFINTMNPLNFFLICLAWFFIAIFITSKLINSPYGMALQATKQNEERVKSVGIETFKVKLIVFVFSGAITGLAGSLYADLNRFVSPSMLNWHTSGEIMVFVILGGIARLYGPLLGAAFFIILEQTLGLYTENWQFWLGLILILEIIFARSGIMGLFDKKNKL